MNYLSNLYNLISVNWINISFFIIFIIFIIFIFFSKTIFLYYYFSILLIWVGVVLVSFEYYAFQWFQFIRNIFFKILNKNNIFYFGFLSENYLILEILFILITSFLLFIICSIFYLLFLNKKYFLMSSFSKTTNFFSKILFLPFIFFGIGTIYTPINTIVEKINETTQDEDKKLDSFVINMIKVFKIFDILNSKNTSIFNKFSNKKPNPKFNTESLLYISQIKEKLNDFKFKDKKIFIEKKVESLLEKYLPKNIFELFKKEVKINESTKENYSENFINFFNNKKYGHYLILSLLLE